MNYNTSEAFESLKAYLIQNFNAKPASGGKEIIKRCHFCGDSRDPSSRHLYIGQKSDGSIVYNCFKCNASGYVDGKFLRNMGCYDPNIMLIVHEQNEKSTSSNQARSGGLRVAKSFKQPIIVANSNPYTEKKLNYVSNRLGHEFNQRDAAMFKVIINLKDFLSVNGITQYTRYPDIVDQLDKFFIGFLSMDNCYVTLRRLVPEGKVSKYIDTRFVNYDIFGLNNNGMRYYTIPTPVYLDRPIDIHIAEGAFDIISIYLHVAPIGTNGIFSAVCGKAYSSLVRFFIVNYGFMGFNLHLYPDKDIDNSEMERIKVDIAPFNIQITVHRNTFGSEKDFGVSMDRIQDSYKII